MKNNWRITFTLWHTGTQPTGLKGWGRAKAEKEKSSDDHGAANSGKILPVFSGSVQGRGTNTLNLQHPSVASRKK